MPARALLTLSLAAALTATALVPAAAQAPPDTGSAATDSAAGERLAGPDRVGTAVALSRRGWDSAGTAVLVRADAFADALAAGLLADDLGAPLLLTARDALSPAAEAELRRLDVDRVVIVGGNAAVAPAVADRLGEIGADVERIAGAHRFATAVAVSEAIGAADGGSGPAGALLALGSAPDERRAWPDALSGGAFAALPEPMALLLTAAELPAPTRTRLADLDVPVTLLGGTAAVPRAVAEELEGVAPSVRRLAGADRYATSRAVAAAVLEQLSDTPRALVVASGADYPDALAAAALVGRIDGLLLLVPPTGIGGDTAAWLEEHRERFSSLLAVGGARALPDAVLAQVAEASGTTAPPAVTTELALSPVDDMGPAWERTFTIGYGEEPSLLGTAPGGENLMLGPEYGAQAPDGTWWFLDAAKDRVAHFDAQGRYLGEVVLGEELLTDGVFFQYQLPRVLADGTLVAFRLSRDGQRTDVLRVRDGRADLVVLARSVFVRADDGERLYGQVDTDEGSDLVAIDLDAATVTPVDAFRGRDGSRWTLSTRPGQLHFTRPDAGQDRTLPVVAAQAPGGPVGYSAEAASDEQGNLHLLLVGVPLADVGQQVGGFTTIRPDGSFAPVEPIRDPFSEAEMGSPAHLGVRPGTGEVWMMFVEPDGVHVYRRSA